MVEVKTTLEIEDVNDHLRRMEKVRKYAYEHGDKREFLGAIAAMVIKPKPKEYALKNGLFVIEPSGEDVKVTKPEGGLVTKEKRKVKREKSKMLALPLQSRA